MAPIVTGDDGESEEWLAHPPWIALWRRSGEARALMQGDHNGARKLSLTGCECTVIMY